ncbi:MAG: hypothetical protein L0229_29185 [Blastocatellia bacterium]|nr:hypothetical protein [Blastocatellia bacterium]
MFKTITLTTRDDGKIKPMLWRTAVLVLIAVIGLGVGWTTGEMLATAIRSVTRSSEPLQKGSESENASHGSEPAPPEIRDGKSGPPSDEKKEESSEEQVDLEVLQELHKKIEEAKQKIKEGDDRDKKGRRKKKGHRKEGEDNGENY